MTQRRKNRRSKGFGNIISVRRGIDGVFDTGTVVGDALPVMLGAGLAVGTTMAIRKFVPATGGGTAGLGDMKSMLVSKAPLIGALAGILAGLGLVYGMGKRTAGTSMIASAVSTGGVLMMSGSGALAGFGAIVPEYGMGAVMPQMNGFGAAVLEDWSDPNHRPDSIGALGDAYGTSVALSGLGSVNTNAFGTPGFNV